MSLANSPAASAVYAPGCRDCPRLAGFLDRVRREHPGYLCKPLPPFGPADASVVIVGLAPGLHGANRTGRAFTGDHCGGLMYDTLRKFGFASGSFSPDGQDDLRMQGCRITCAVKCLPPDNKPETAEVARCNRYLAADLARAGAKVLVALGVVAHGAALMALGLKKSSFKFAHGAEHELPGGARLIDSYHCSRYNTNTGRLTTAMFEAVFARARNLVDA